MLPVYGGTNVYTNITDDEWSLYLRLMRRYYLELRMLRAPRALRGRVAPLMLSISSGGIVWVVPLISELWYRHIPGTARNR